MNLRKPGIFLLISLGGLLSFAQQTTHKACFQSQLSKPVAVKQIGEGHYLFDFGKAAFGTVQLNLGTAQLDTLLLHLGEKTDNAGNIDRKPGGTIRYQKLKIAGISANEPFLLKLQAVKRNTTPPAILLPDSFGVVMPFRYCEIENLKVPVDQISVFQKSFNYCFNDAASAFSSSDTVLNRVWEMCKHTIKATSFCGLYVDGDRERIPYEADAYINQLSHYCVDNEYTLARNTNEYFIHNPTWPTEWILHTVLLFYNDYMYTGDISSIARYYEQLKYKTLRDLARADGLISIKSPAMTNDFMQKIGFKNGKQRLNDIVDWPEGERDGYEMREINTVVNAFYYRNLVLMSEIATKLGKMKDATEFKSLAKLVYKSFNQKLLSLETGLYVDGEGSIHTSLHANIFPLLFGLAPEKQKAQILTFIKSRGMACSVYGAQYLLEALYQNGEADYALSLMNAQTDRSWWNMIAKGSTMAFEAWDIKYKPNQDWNHAWGTAPLNAITRNMWGIIPSKPGFDQVTITPQLSHLTSTEIKVPTAKGTIFASYKSEGKLAIYQINLPEKMKAIFNIPADYTKLFVNKKARHNFKNGIELQAGNNIIELSHKNSQ